MPDLIDRGIDKRVEIGHDLHVLGSKTFVEPKFLAARRGWRLFVLPWKL